MPMSHAIRKTGCIWECPGTQAREGLSSSSQTVPGWASPREKGPNRAVGHLKMERMHVSTRRRQISGQVTREYSGKCYALGLAPLSKQKYLNLGSTALYPGMKC